MMDKYDIEHFDAYFRGSWIIGLDGEVARVMGVVDRRQNIISLSKSGSPNGVDFVNVSTADLDWRNLAIPVLGYRNIGNRGHCLVRMVRRVGRVTGKAFSQSTVKIEGIQQVTNALHGMETTTRTYSARLVHDKHSAQAAFFPEYTSFEEAIHGITKSAKTTGYAINSDIALVLGYNQHNSLLLLWKGFDAAYSEDGTVWRLTSKDYKDSLDRGLGKLRYAK